MSGIRLVHGGLSAEVSGAFGAILSFRIARGGAEFDLFRPAPRGRPERATDTGCFPLVPFGNRVRGNCFVFNGKTHRLRPNTDEPVHLHGDGWLSEWTIGRVTTASAELRLRRRSGDGAPFQYEARQTVSLADGALSVALSIINRGDEPLPFGVGLHPYFPLEPGVTLHAPAAGWWEEGKDHLPTRRRSFDDGFDFRRPAPIPARWVNNGFDGWIGKAEISWPERNLAVAIESDELFRHYALFTPGPGNPGESCHDYFCFEPMSHAVSAFDRTNLGGLRVLGPNQELAGTVRFAPSIG